MAFILPHKFPRMFYQAFVKDGLRLYKALPNSLKIRYWGIFVIQFLAAVTETFTLLVISLFAMSVAFSEAARNHFMVKPLLALSPALKSYCDDPRNFVTFTCSLMVAFIALKVSLSIFSSHKTTLFSENVALHISQETLRRFLGKNYFWHLSPDSSSVILKLMNRVVLSQFLVLLLQLYSNVLCCLALFTSMAIIEPKLTLAVMSIFFTASLSAYLFLRRRIDRAGHQVAALSADETAGMMVVNRGIREIIIYHRQEIFLNRVINLIRRGIKPRAFLAFSGNVPGQFLEFIGFSTVAIIMITMIVSGLPMPEIAAASSVLLLTAWRVLPSVSRSLSFTVAIRGLRPQALSSLELLEIFIAENPEKPPAPNPDFHFEKTVGLYEASFHYPAAGADALTKITAVVEKGWNVGLIGPSGAGKSTLALLLSGLVAPQSGRFLVDGQTLSPEDLAAYAQLVGFVPQNPVLYQGTVADNVAFSRWGEDYDRQEVAEACQMAAMDFVFSHPLGIDMPLAADGAGLSGGQAQRVAIARALFTKPEIIIFDEATSSLDQASENIIKNTIDHLQGRATCIIIAHRLTTVENCDQLFWVDQGGIRAIGPPEKILPLYLDDLEIKASPVTVDD